MPLNFTTPTVGQNDSTEEPLIVTALNAIKSWANGGISDGDLASNVVNQSNMKDASVGTAELQDASVTANKLASNAVTTAKILDDNVTTAKLDAPPHCILAKSGYSVPTSTADIVFESADEAVDLSGMHSGTTNKTRISFSTNGLYYAHGAVLFPSVTSSFACVLALKFAGVTVDLRNETMSDTGDGLSVGCFLPISVASYVTLDCYNLSGAPITSTAVRFNAIYLGKIT